MVWESDLPSESSEIGSGDESQSSGAEQSLSSFTEPEVSSVLVEAAGLTTQKVKGQTRISQTTADYIFSKTSFVDDTFLK